MPETLDPEQARFLLQLGLRTLAQERRLTTRVIAAVPPDRSGYRPDPVSKTAFELSWHIVGSEIMFLDGIATGAFVYDPPCPASLRAPADIIAWYEAAYRERTYRLRDASIEQLLRMTDFRGLFARPAVLFLQTAIRHTAHHRGQLSVYLRPMGAKVPPIYGDSFDEPWAGTIGSATSLDR